MNVLGDQERVVGMTMNPERTQVKYQGLDGGTGPTGEGTG